MAKKNVKNYVYSLLLSLLPSFSVYLSSFGQFLLFLFILILFVILRLDVRFFIILGIITLIFSALFLPVLGNVAYFYLLFGVIGIIMREFLSSKSSTKVNEKAGKEKASKQRKKKR